MNRSAFLTLLIPLSQAGLYDSPFEIDPLKAWIASPESGGGDGGESHTDFENSGCSEFGVWQKIPGKEETPHDLFLALEFENSLKRTAAFDHPLYQQFEAQVLKPNAQKIEVLEFEMDPGKDVRFS